MSLSGSSSNSCTIVKDLDVLLSPVYFDLGLIFVDLVFISMAKKQCSKQVKF